jgi:hypothetical protein
MIMTALVQLRKLEHYVTTYGDDQLIASSLSKIVDYKIQRYETILNDLRSDLLAFEQQYQQQSDEFYRAFKRGELGDDMDFVEWGSLYEMYQRILEKKNLPLLK